MADAPVRSQLTGWVGLVAMATLGIAGVVATKHPLTSPRPSAAGMLWREPGAADKVPARLWQDPLTAVYKELPEDREGQYNQIANFPGPDIIAKDVKKLLESAEHAPAPSGGKSVLVIPVVVSGDRWPESEEGRLTNRYAILAALGTAGFVPDDRQNISVFGLITGYEPMVQDRHGPPRPILAAIPYEWFSKADSQRRVAKAVVLWVRADRLATSDRLRMLSGLLDKIGAAQPSQALSVSVLGPSDSNMLVDVLNEDRARGGAINLRDASLYAFSATISADRLSEELAALMPPDATQEERRYLDRFRDSRGPYPMNCGAKLHRTIGTDADLSQLLARELKWRGVSPAADKRHVVILHEWDTVYGRSLPASFAAACTPAGALDDGTIHTYRYLRGLDGRLPGETPTTEASPLPALDKPAPASAPAVGEMPIGTTQLDYVRRLVREIGADEETREQEGRGRLAAIGIFGSDVYDKMLLMQAVHEEFPDTILFTTDLYARLLQPAAYESATRNAIVASHFGLSLGGRLQRSVPPFRTVYQTGLYFAGLLAAGDPAARSAYNDALLRSRENPAGDTPAAADPAGIWAHIYEIGRTGAYDLQPPADRLPRPAGAAAADLFPAAPRSHALGAAARSELVGALLLGLCGVCLLGFGLYNLKDWAEDGHSAVAPRTSGRPAGNGATSLHTSQWRRLIVTVAAVAAAVAAGGSAYLLFAGWAARLPSGEPFQWFEGISMWPSEIIRVVVCFLCVAFLVKMYYELQANSRWMAEEFGLPPRFPEAPRLSLLRRPLLFFRHVSIVGWEPRLSHGTVNAERVWKRHLFLGHLRSRATRVVPVFLIHAGLIIGLFLWFGFPVPPYRGSASLWIDRVTMILSLVLVNALTLTVWDATRLCERFIRNLSRGPSTWPGDARQYMRWTRGDADPAASVWLDIRIIAERTRIVGRTIYYPFVVLPLAILALSHKIDNWPWSFPVVVAYSLSAAIAVAAGASLRSAAEHARSIEVARLRDELLRTAIVEAAPEGHGHYALAADIRGGLDAVPPSGDRPEGPGEAGAGGSPAAGGPALLAAKPGTIVEHKVVKKDGGDGQLPTIRQAAKLRIEETIRDVLGIQIGAFGPFTQNPLVRAIVIPFGGFGAVQLADFALRLLR